MDKKDTLVPNLGPCSVDSPLDIPQFIDESSRMVIDTIIDVNEKKQAADREPLTFENAGPRKKIFFNPGQIRTAIVTCGGLCPGINNVIKGLFTTLYFQYGVKTVLGIRYGYEGLIPGFGHKFMELSHENTDDIHEKGGSILGSSRGDQDISAMVDTLVRENISVLFTVGGDGTLRGAQRICKEIAKRKLPIAIVGVPKTVDNDLNYMDKTFGFETAVALATEVIRGAHWEARGARDGIGLVKLMGRDAGFICTHSTIASNEVNFCLIPEVPFRMDGSGGLLDALHQRLAKRHHAMITVSEGAGQEFFKEDKKYDSSGNVRYGDIGAYLKGRIMEYFKNTGITPVIKYIDPSYYVRSMPASASDAVFCMMLAQNAVHAGMAGKTGLVVGRWNNLFTYIPIELVVNGRKKVDPNGYLWTMVKQATGQPDMD
jgi:6-phosphofructokinase 1